MTAAIQVKTWLAGDFVSSAPIKGLSKESSRASLLKGSVSTEEYFAVVDFNLRAPFLSRRIESDPDYTTCVIGSIPTIAKIGGVFYRTNVATAIVETVAVNVIHILARLRVGNQSMYLYKRSSRKPLLCIKGTSPFVQAPFTTAIPCFKYNIAILLVKDEFLNAMCFAYDFNFHIYILTKGRQLVKRQRLRYV